MEFTINEKTDEEKECFKGSLGGENVDLTDDENIEAFKERPAIYAGLEAFAQEMGKRFGFDKVTLYSIHFAGVNYTGPRKRNSWD